MAAGFNQHLQEIPLIRAGEAFYQRELHTLREARGEAVLAQKGGGRHARRGEKNRCN